MNIVSSFFIIIFSLGFRIIVGGIKGYSCLSYCYKWELIFLSYVNQVLFLIWNYLYFYGFGLGAEQKKKKKKNTEFVFSFFLMV